MESWFNEPLYKEVLDITNDFLYPNNYYRKMYEKEPRYNETSLSRPNLGNPLGGFVKSRPSLYELSDLNRLIKDPQNLSGILFINC